MICVPPDLEPLALLRAYCCENLEKGARILMCDCDKMCRLNDLEYADSIAQDAEDRGADGDWHGCVVVLLILAEACRKANELTRAHRYGERAFACCQGPADESKMTEAVAAYSLGIINYLQGERKEAGRRYEHGHRLFKEVEEDCLRANDREQAEYCDHAARLITKLWEHSSRQRFKAHGGRYPVLTGFCTSSDDAIGYCIAEMKTVGAPSGWQVSIEGELYRLIPLPGKDLNALTISWCITARSWTAATPIDIHWGSSCILAKGQWSIFLTLLLPSLKTWTETGSPEIS
jgi:hypothetical protein